MSDKFEGIIKIGNKEYHIRNIFFEIFEMGKNSHKDITIQTLFEYWIKEKMGEL